MLKHLRLPVSFKKSKHTGKQKVHKANLSNVNKCGIQKSEALTRRSEASRLRHPWVNLTRLCSRAESGLRCHADFKTAVKGIQCRSRPHFPHKTSLTSAFWAF